MNESKDSIGKGELRKKIIIVAFSILVFGLVAVSLGYILPITSNVCAQQIDECDDPPPPPESCACGDCVNGCGGGCADADGDSLCDSGDNCVGTETIGYEQVCVTVCNEEDPYTGECRNSSTECEVTGVFNSCQPYYNF